MPWANKKFLATADANGRHSPEARLWAGVVGGPIFGAGMFWLGWSAYPNVHWIVPALAGLPLGLGVMTIFMSSMAYLTDAYGLYAASALAANTVSRSLLGFAFPLFSVDMYHQLGIQWACSLLGFLALALAPVPILFLRYGRQLRLKRSTQGNMFFKNPNCNPRKTLRV